MSFFQFEDYKLHYIETGTDDDLVILLIHGGHRELQNISAWQENVEPLSEIVKVVAVDLLGHGDSIPGSSPQKNKPVVAEQVEILKKLIQQKYPQKSIIPCGRSYGCTVALDLAKQIPDQIAALVLISPAGASNYASYPELHALPTLLTWAKNDPIIPFSQKDTFEQNCSQLTTLYFDQVGIEEEVWKAHSVQSERSDQFNQVLVEFIKTIR